MTLKIKLRGDKAIVRFNNKYEEQFFVNTWLKIRDGDPKIHPKISIKDNNGELKPLPKPMKTPPPDQLPTVKPEVKPTVIPTEEIHVEKKK